MPPTDINELSEQWTIQGTEWTMNNPRNSVTNEQSKELSELFSFPPRCALKKWEHWAGVVASQHCHLEAHFPTTLMNTHVSPILKLISPYINHLYEFINDWCPKKKAALTWHFKSHNIFCPHHHWQGHACLNVSSDYKKRKYNKKITVVKK